MVNPASAPAGHDFYLSGQGQCDGNARAAQFAIFGQPFGEYGGNTASATWSSAGWMPGNVTVCFRITAGDWANMAESCTTITLTDGGTPSNNTTQGPPVTNNQPGQSNQSNPNTSAPPQNNQNQNTTTTNTNQNTQNSSTTSCNNLSRLSIGSVATISDATPATVPLRRSASINADALVQVPVLTRLTITAGPSCNGRFVWWQTSYSGQTGWIAEVNGSNNYNLIPASTQTTNSRNQSNTTTTNSNTTTASVSVCSSDFGLTSGISAMISTDPPMRNNLRSGAGTTNALLLQIPAGGEIDIISGPRCAEGFVWWQVTYNGQTGWTVEGDDGVAWVVRASGGTTSIITTSGTYLQHCWDDPRDGCYHGAHPSEAKVIFVNGIMNTVESSEISRILSR